MSSARERGDAKKNEGNEAFKARKYDEAIRLYTEAIDLDHTSHVYYSNRAAAYLGKEAWEEAAKDGEECVHLNKNFVKGYHRWALALKGMKQYAKAMETLKAGQKVDFNNKDLNNLINEVEPLAKSQEASKRSSLPEAEQIKVREIPKHCLNSNECFLAARK